MGQIWPEGDPISDIGGKLCFGIDVGGTFTDCVLTEGDRVWRAKSPTTPGEIGKGVINAARLAAEGGVVGDHGRHSFRFS